jgi:3-oxoadipate enol-lactonase
MERAEVNGTTLAYEVTGAGEPILLIHGSHIADTFAPMTREPALEGFQLVRYHRRGLGDSGAINPPFELKDQAADAIALLDHLGIGSAHVVGHSYGGATALQLAADAPERVRSLVLLEAALLNVPSGPELMGEIGPAFEQFAAGSKTEAVDTFMSAVSDAQWRENTTNVLGSDAVDQAIRDADTFFAVEIPAIMTWSFGADEAGSIGCPVLYVYGGDSRKAFQEGADLARPWFKACEVVVIDGVNHMLQAAQPTKVAEVIATFVRKHAAATV